MGKELTLEQLASQEANNLQKANVKQTSDAIKTAKEVSINDLAKNLPGREPSEEGTKPPIIVENAFKAMDERLAESKRFISEEMMPIVEENAREMAMEKELGGAPKDEDNDLIDNDIEDAEDNREEAPVEEVPEDDFGFEDDNQEPVKEVAKEKPAIKEQPKVEAKIEEDITEQDITSDISDIDSLINDLNKEEDDFTVEDTDTEESVEEARERFKETLNEEIKITKNEFDISEFTIDKNPISSSVILNSINKNKTTKKADWVLLGTGRSIRMEEGTGPELDALRKTIDNSNNLNGVIASLKMVYEHIVDANKPSFETWCKTTKTEDLESIYFAYYLACYGDVNLVGRTCPDPKTNKGVGCNKTSIINTPVKSMVKFKDKETEERFNTLLQQDTTTSGNNAIKSKMIIASDDIAISYSDPTLYTTFIQFSTLPPNIVDKYSDLLNSLAYINGFYAIDKVNKKFKPIAVKVSPNNLNKTILSKLKVYLEVLKTLTNDQYNVLTAKLNNLIQESKISYIYPKTTCPECGAEIPEEEVQSVLSLLFTRAQLAQVKSL